MAKVYSVVGQKGGTGKSMVARLLAVELAQRGKSVVLVDLDVAQRTSAEWGNARKLNKLEPAIEIVVVDADDDRGWQVTDLEGDYEALVLDAPGFSDELTVQIAEQADLVILPSGAALDDLRPTIRLMHELNGAGIETDSVAIVLNKIDSDNETSNARNYLRLAGISAIEPSLRNMPSYRKAADHGQSAAEVPQKRLQIEAVGVADALIAIGEKQAKLRDEEAEKPMRFVLAEGETW